MIKKSLKRNTNEILSQVVFSRERERAKELRKNVIGLDSGMTSKQQSN